MRNLVIKYGRFNTTLLLTFVSIFASLLVTYVSKWVVGSSVNQDNIVLSIITPIIVCPIVSWGFLGLIIRIDQLEKEQRFLASYDGLTGLLSRNAFFTEFSKALRRANSVHDQLGVAIIDLDDFKKINDTYGHAAGDEVLMDFSNVLRQTLTKADLSGRIGGEEFAVVLPSNSIKECTEVFDKIRALSEESQIKHMDLMLNYTISVGFTFYKHPSDNGVSELLKQSDEALYKAKGAGKNRIVQYQ
ncbi:diguanylate cyclase [Marinomonas epiphytica]